jgi:hypothetical protein
MQPQPNQHPVNTHTPTATLLTSSSMSTRGLVTMAMPMLVRLAWPPLMPLLKLLPICTLRHALSASLSSSWATAACSQHQHTERKDTGCRVENQHVRHRTLIAEQLRELGITLNLHQPPLVWHPPAACVSRKALLHQWGARQQVPKPQALTSPRPTPVHTHTHPF